MPAVEVEFRLSSIERYVEQQHGEMRGLVPEEAEVLEFWADFLVDYVRDRWPVDTGTSRDMWSIEVFTTPSEGYRIDMSNPMFYASYVHLEGTPAEPPLWQTLIPEAWDVVRPQLVADLRDAVDLTQTRLSRMVQTGVTPVQGMRAILSGQRVELMRG